MFPQKIHDFLSFTTNQTIKTNSIMPIVSLKLNRCIDLVHIIINQVTCQDC